MPYLHPFLCLLAYTLPLINQTIRSSFLAYRISLGLSGSCEHQPYKLVHNSDNCTAGEAQLSQGARDSG